MKTQKHKTIRWTGAKASSFLKLLAEHGNITRAAREVGMSRKSAYALRSRAPEFAHLWLVALAEYRRMRVVEKLQAKAVHPLLDKRPRRVGSRSPQQSRRAGDSRSFER